jgi:hypothetical protein
LLPDHKLGLTLHGTPGATYVIQHTPSLSDPITWTNLVQIVPTNTVAPLELPLATQGMGFYRALQGP